VTSTGAQFTSRLGSQSIDLPLVEVAPDVAIALFITFDRGISTLQTAGRELAERLRPHGPEVVATNATCGIPVAIEVSRALGLDDYVVLQKTPKINLADAYTEPLSSITTDRDQALRLDRARQPAVAGRRTVLVDDVISTGGSINAGSRLLRSAGADLVGIGLLFDEGDEWREALGDDAGLVHSLGHLPVFRRDAGGWEPIG